MCVGVCAFTSIQEMEAKQMKQVGKGPRKMGKEGEQRCVLLGKHTSNMLVPRRVWDHNFSIQLEVKLGSSSIDFFPGFVAVFLSTNSECRPSPTLDVIPV